MKNKILLWCGLAMFFICTSVFAEVVYLNSGKKVEGNIVSQDNEKVVVRIGGEEGADVTFFSDEIQRIEITESSEPITNITVVEIESRLPLETPQLIPLSATDEKKQEVSLPQPDKTEAVQVKEETKEEVKVEEKVEEKAVEPDEEAEVSPKTQMTVVPKVNMVVESKPTQAPVKPQTIEQVLSQPAQQEALQKGAEILNELTALLDEQELKYFTELNSAANDVVNKIMQIVVNPASVSQDPTNLMQTMEGLSTDTANLINKMGNVQPPHDFANFHSYYLTNLNLLKDVLVGMSKGNANALQAKVAQLQEVDTKIQQELSSILVQKKNKAQIESGNVAN